MMSKRQRPTKALPPASAPKQSMQDQFEEALQKRDFSKAVAMLEFFKSLNQPIGDLQVNPWLAYSAFHMGDFTKSADVYREMLVQDDCDAGHWLHLACCHFGNGQYKDALEATKKGPSSNLKNRLMFHLAHKMGDEKKMADYNALLKDTVEDQLSLAAMNYFRGHYSNAIEIYQSILVASRGSFALNVYLAMCFYKQDYYDVSLELLNTYIQTNSDSAIAANLKACNHFRVYNGKAAENELKVLVNLQTTSYNVENDVVKHNVVVFRGGEDALQALPPLVDVIVPEARLNLVVFHIKNDQVSEAYDLIKDLDPVSPQEHILKAVVNSLIGQQADSQNHLKAARELFQIVGSSPSECDTIPGRQCMASCFFLMQNFTDVLVYLNSIREFFATDDTFLYLLGITCGATGSYVDGETALISVKSDRIKADYSYLAWLVRCHIMSRHAKKAWDLYLKMDTSTESFSILQLIANDCYKIGSFYYAAKAFDVLERLDTATEYVDGLRGACVGVLQQVAAEKEPGESLWDVIRILESSAKSHMDAGRGPQGQQADRICHTMRSWAKDANLGGKGRK